MISRVLLFFIFILIKRKSYLRVHKSSTYFEGNFYLNDETWKHFLLPGFPLSYLFFISYNCIFLNLHPGLFPNYETGLPLRKGTYLGSHFV